METSRLSRRSFLKRAGLLSAPLILPANIFGSGWRAAPGNRVTIGMIGVGDHGVARNLRGFLAQPDAQIVAVCDVDGGRCRKAQELVNKAYGNTDCAGYQDFREILARSDVDAVMISTPDHWHATISLMAIRAGKDVICEKPTLTLADVHAALAYYFDHVDQIQQEMRDERLRAEELHRSHPSPLEAKLRQEGFQRAS